MGQGNRATGDDRPTFCYAGCVAPAVERAVEADVPVEVDACDGDGWTPAGHQVVVPVPPGGAPGAIVGPGYPVAHESGASAYVVVGPEEVVVP
jgi:hypothetical protein